MTNPRQVHFRTVLLGCTAVCVGLALWRSLEPHQQPLLGSLVGFLAIGLVVGAPLGYSIQGRHGFEFAVVV